MIEPNPISGALNAERKPRASTIRKDAALTEHTASSADCVTAHSALEQNRRPLFGGGFGKSPKLFRAEVNLRDKQAMIDKIVADDAKSISTMNNDVT